MRAFFITATVLSLIYIVATVAIAQEVRSARNAALDEMLNSYLYDDDYSSDYSSGSFYSSNYDEEADSATQTGGVISVLFMILCAAVFLLALVRIRTQTMKVLSIIGLSVSGLFMLWAFLPMSSPGGVSFDEVGLFFAAAGIALLGLQVVGIVQAFRTEA